MNHLPPYSGSENINAPARLLCSSNWLNEITINTINLIKEIIKQYWSVFGVHFKFFCTIIPSTNSQKAKQKSSFPVMFRCQLFSEHYMTHPSVFIKCWLLNTLQHRYEYLSTEQIENVTRDSFTNETISDISVINHSETVHNPSRIRN